MTRLNCPNCGAPIDIHRRSCEYCGTPYDMEDRIVLCADNQPVYIYQEPIKWNDNQYATLVQELANASARAGLMSLNDFNNSFNNNSIQNLQSKLNYVNSQTCQAYQAEQIRQSCNSLPKVSYGSLIEEPEKKHSDIWELVKWILIVLAGFSPLIICIILGLLHII